MFKHEWYYLDPFYLILLLAKVEISDNEWCLQADPFDESFQNVSGIQSDVEAVKLYTHLKSIYKLENIVLA